MITWHARLIGIFSFLLTVLAILMVLSHFTSYLVDKQYTLSIDQVSPIKSTMSYQKGGFANQSDFSFSLKGHECLPQLFNWNVKQLYLYLVVEGENGEKGVVWDIILENADEAQRFSNYLQQHSQYPSVAARYRIIGKGFQPGSNVKCSLHASIMPITGLFKRRLSESSTTIAVK
ncbi:Signal peptidase complex subunit 3 like protein [Aduncisulcus paluster]|uniref:Signal peptidase complex subunit 3 n=1 Tax=Aduncisulcus paluster TaxID=2918883 RepID=A0ABQ5K6Q6_9EUKA|nr:Signal peptidase complex subunit 3 like protein [Aduncisulcus paluster]